MNEIIDAFRIFSCIIGTIFDDNTPDDESI